MLKLDQSDAYRRETVAVQPAYALVHAERNGAAVLIPVPYFSRERQLPWPAH